MATESVGYGKMHSCGTCLMFSGCEVYICEFHRQQAWERWVALAKHGVRSIKDEVLARLRQIADARTLPEYNSLVAKLKNDNIWLKHTSLQHWFEKTWLHESKVCNNCYWKLLPVHA